MPNQNEPQKQWAKIVAKAWADEDYKQQLLTDPASVMIEAGFKLPEGVEYKCVEAAEKELWLVLPPKPVGAIREGEERLAAGAMCECICI